MTFTFKTTAVPDSYGCNGQGCRERLTAPGLCKPCAFAVAERNERMDTSVMLHHSGAGIGFGGPKFTPEEEAELLDLYGAPPEPEPSDAEIAASTTGYTTEF